MPLEWDSLSERAPDDAGARSHADPVARLKLWPHRSMPRQGFAAFIGVTFLFLLMPLFPLLGTPVLWALLPFLMGALALLWLMLERNYADGALVEVLTLWSDRVELVRKNPRGPDQFWEANPHWVRVELHEDGGPVEKYLTLSGSDRTVELGAFLSPEERDSVYRDLSDRLRALRR